METKVCSKCGKEKNVNEFYKSSASSSGYQYYCKECSRLANSASFKMKEKVIAFSPSERFAEFKDRELLDELRKRGWKGKLIFTVKKEVDL